MRRTITVICGILLCSAAYGQRTGSVTGTLVDDANGEAIIGAVVEFTAVADPERKNYSPSGRAGAIEANTLPYGDYKLKVSFLGYENLERDVTVNQRRVDLGELRMKTGSQQIEEVVLEIQAIRTSQKGDTVIYNSDAFKVSKDADAEALLSKMPGITIIDGQIEAQGETVQKVFVDSKEFFGGDVNIAIKNLPAEVISKVEVYNKLSDQAEFTGINDGEDFKAINLVTTINSGQFGKFYAGYGFNDKYLVGGNYNYFKGDRRISILGMANNINQQNFALEDILGAVDAGGGMSSRGGGGMRMRGAGSFMTWQRDGISEVASIGTNYTDKWGKQKKVEAELSYFFNVTDNNNVRKTDRWYEGSTNEDELFYKAQANTWSRNFEHRINGRIEYKINDNHSLMFRPRVSLQTFKSENDTESNTYQGTSVLDDLVNTIFNSSNSKNNGYNIGNSMIYRVKLGKAGRTLTVDANFNLRKNDRNSFNETITMVPGKIDSLFRQNATNDTKSYRLEGSAIYTEPVSENAQISLQYRANYEYSDADKKAYLWNEIMGMFEENLSPEYSNINNSGYLTQRVGPGINVNKNGNVFSANVFFQRSSLTSDQEYPIKQDISANFNDVTYFAMLNKSFNSTNKLRIHANSSTSNPSISQLQDVLDLSNTQFLSAGNANLDPTYNHRLFMNYTRSSVTKGRTFMVMGGYSISSNSIVSDLTTTTGGENKYIEEYDVTISNGQQFTRPVNMNGSWNVSGGISYGTPLNFMKSNVNINANVHYNESPSRINDEKNINKTQSYGGELVLGSNINEFIDFTLSYAGSYNNAKNTIRENNDNEYLTHRATARFKWEFWKGFTFSGNANYTLYKFITDETKEDYLTCNLTLGKKVFRNRRGEVQVTMYDVFDQNSGFSRNIQSTYTENVRNQVLGRFVSVQFIYNLRSFGNAQGGRGGGEMLRGPGSGGPPPGGGWPGGRM